MTNLEDRFKSEGITSFTKAIEVFSEVKDIVFGDGDIQPLVEVGTESLWYGIVYCEDEAERRALEIEREKLIVGIDWNKLFESSLHYEGLFRVIADKIEGDRVVSPKEAREIRRVVDNFSRKGKRKLYFPIKDIASGIDSMPFTVTKRPVEPYFSKTAHLLDSYSEMVRLSLDGLTSGIRKSLRTRDI